MCRFVSPLARVPRGGRGSALSFCAVPGKQWELRMARTRKQKLSWGSTGRVFVLILIVLFGLQNCGGVSNMPDVGEEGVFWVGEDVSVYVSPTRKYCERAEQLIFARDNKGLSDMFNAGEVWLIPSGTRFRVIEMRSTYEVRILGGEHKGKSGFVSSSYVRKP